MSAVASRSRGIGHLVGTATLVAAALLLAPATARAQGLEPPPPSSTPSSPYAGPGAPSTTSTTQSELDAAEREDSGRGLEWVWLNAEAGAAYVNMTSFSSDELALVETSGGGPMFGVGAGIRLLVLTLGARARVLPVSTFTLWQLGGEVGLHVPIGRFDPYVNLHGAYAFVGAIDPAAVGTAVANPSDVTLRGGSFGVSVGGDYYFSNTFSLGLDGTFDGLYLVRPRVDVPPDATPAQANAALATQDGSGFGYVLAGSFHVGLHF